MGARRRTRQTGREVPLQNVHARHNRHDGYTWTQHLAETAAREAANAARRREEEPGAEEDQ